MREAAKSVNDRPVSFRPLALLRITEARRKFTGHRHRKELMLGVLKQEATRRLYAGVVETSRARPQ